MTIEDGGAPHKESWVQTEEHHRPGLLNRGAEFSFPPVNHAKVFT